MTEDEKKIIENLPVHPKLQKQGVRSMATYSEDIAIFKSEFASLIGDIKLHTGRWERSNISRKKAIDLICERLMSIHFKLGDEND